MLKLIVIWFAAAFAFGIGYGAYNSWVQKDDDILSGDAVLIGATVAMATIVLLQNIIS